MSDPATPVPDEKDWTVVLTEGCAECGFDPRLDVTRTGERLRSGIPRWTQALARSDATRRPDPQVWSTVEYAAHVRDVCDVFRERLALMLAPDAPAEGAPFDNWDQDETALVQRY